MTNDYLVAYRHRTDHPEVLQFYRFAAEDAEHAIEQFRAAEPSPSQMVVFVVVVG